MENEKIALKIGMFLKENESVLSATTLQRLAETRSTVMALHRAKKSGKIIIEKYTVITLAASLSSLIMAAFLASMLLTSTSTGLAIDNHYSIEKLPTRAFVDSNFQVWTAHPDESDDKL